MSEAPAPRWAWWLATGLGSGYLRPAPGTWGSLVAAALWLLLVTGLRRLGLPAMGTAAVALQAIGLGVLAGLVALAVRVSDRVVRETGHKDPHYIVLDEWIGTWIALHPLLLPALGSPLAGLSAWGALALAFTAFRVFDILKPWPCDALQALPGGRGIVADDLVAGLYAALLTTALGPGLFPGFFRP